MKAVVLPVVACLGLSGCTGLPAEALLLPPGTVEDRAMQTRTFETDTELDLLRAGAGVLQDMGFVVNDSETRLGLITGSKTVSAKDFRQIAGAVALAVIGIPMPINSKQAVSVSLVTSPSKNRDNAFLARALFQRTVHDPTGEVNRAETLRTPELYEGFFEKLSKSVFLDSQALSGAHAP